MKTIETILWLPSIIEKNEAKHGVSRDEVDFVLKGGPVIVFLEDGARDHEDVYLALGRTDDGRYLAVIFVDKFRSAVMPISARDMSRAERKRYEKAKS